MIEGRLNIQNQNGLYLCYFNGLGKEVNLNLSEPCSVSSFSGYVHQEDLHLLCSGLAHC